MITTIDMHIRDERVFNWLKNQSKEGLIQVSANTIADEFLCHTNTAQAILRRLRRAGIIEVVEKPYNHGFWYKINA